MWFRNAGGCVPPAANKPSPDDVTSCRHWGRKFPETEFPRLQRHETNRVPQEIASLAKILGLKRTSPLLMLKIASVGVGVTSAEGDGFSRNWECLPTMSIRFAGFRPTIEGPCPKHDRQTRKVHKMCEFSIRNHYSCQSRRKSDGAKCIGLGDDILSEKSRRTQALCISPPWHVKP